MLKKTDRSRDRRVRPLRVFVGRSDEQLVNARGIGAIPVHQIVGRDTVAFRLRHHHATPLDHPLSEEPGERLGRLQAAGVVQHLLKKARVEQVEDGVLDSTRVLVDRHPVVGQLGVERLRVVVS